MAAESFEGLGLSDETVEALSAGGFERPTALQSTAVPLIRRGNNFVGIAGPGAGTLLAFGAPLIDRLADAEIAAALVLTDDPETAERSARSLGRLASLRGIDVSAVVSSWSEPFAAHVVFSTPEAVLSAVRGSRLSLETFGAVVLDHGVAEAGRPETEAVIQMLEKGTQRVAWALPDGAAAEPFLAIHLRKAVRYPPQPADPALRTRPADRGTLEYRLCPAPRVVELTRTVGTLLTEGAERVVVHVATDDQAADVGDVLELYGYRAGAPGDGDAPVWLAAPSAETPEESATHHVSADVPPDTRSLLARHEGARASLVLLSGRELPHLRQIAAEAGFTLQPHPRTGSADPILRKLEERIARGMDSGALAPFLLAVERLSDRYDPVEIAAAALALASDPSGKPATAGKAGTLDAPTRPVDAFVRLFLSVGSKDGVRAGDLLGAITGESGLSGDSVGKIEIRDTFSLIEVPGASADRVIRSLNGISIRGRSVRADYDRQSARRKRTR